MKKLIETELPFCDACEKDAVYGCAGCDKDTCLTCRDATFVAYLKNFNLDSSSIYPVCNDCDENPNEELLPTLTLVKEIDTKIKAELLRRERGVKRITKFATEGFNDLPQSD